MSSDFHRVAIVNRGEPAMRLIHAVRELNAQQNARDAIRTIALFTEPDGRSMFVRAADEAMDLGPAAFVDRDGERKSSYLDYARLELALRAAEADAAWVGWGFVAEHAEFAELCRRLGIVFIGPEPEVIRRLGDKICSKRLAESAGVPVVPWSGGAVETGVDAQHAAERLGYPLMIKATKGGGGRGIRRVACAAALQEAFVRARGEALRAFGDPAVFLERVVPAARHVEVQIIADAHGTTWALGVRDCSIQRRNQKLIEEAPSPVLSPAEDEALRAAAIRICETTGYQNAGTVEFLFEPTSRAFYFIEVNTRLQVEHPVTEVTTGLDLVKLQLHVARGGLLEGTPPRPVGHAIEVRLNAEDPDHNFAPAPGMIEILRLPTGPGLRIDTGVDPGDRVPPEFDSMIAKLIAYGRDREEALSRLRRALADSLIVIRGGTTNKAFLLELLHRSELCAATADTAWLDRLGDGAGNRRPHADVALLRTAIEVYDGETTTEQLQFYVSAARGRPHAQPHVGRTAELRYRGNTYKLTVFRIAADRYLVDAGGHRIELRIDRLGPYECWLTYPGGRRFRVLSVAQGLNYLVEVDGVPHQIVRDDGGWVRAPSPAVVLSIAVHPGDVVAAGARLLVLEAMKMEIPVAAPFAGRVRQVTVMPNVQVDAGAPLVLMEASTASEAGVGGRVAFAAPEPCEHVSAHVRCERLLERVKRLMLGFDLDAIEAKRLSVERDCICKELTAADEMLQRGEDEVLSIFADLCALFRRQPATDDPDTADALRTEEYLFTYVRTLDTQGAGLPESFLDKVRAALRHYGVTTLEPTPELKESLLRVFKSHARQDQHTVIMLQILERRLACVQELPAQTSPTFRAVLDRLVVVTHGRYPAVCEMARELRYRYFDQMLFERARQSVYASVDMHLAELARHPDSPDRAERVRALVDCPQPLAGALAGRFSGADTPMRELMLEVLTRRYYRIRNIEDVTCRAISPLESSAHTEYDHQAKRIDVIAMQANASRLSPALTLLGPQLDEIPADHDIVLDVYVWRGPSLSDIEQTQAEIAAAINHASFPRQLRRLAMVVAGDADGRTYVHHFTYRPSPTGYVEEKLYRGLHPMIAKRMQLWRLSNFDIERLPSVEDVYLFRGVARANSKDERLFAVAEVRDLSPVRDASGRIAQLPYLERMLMEALAGIRQFRSHHGNERLIWNRVLLYVWPVVDLRPDELQDIVRKLAPATEGLGLEQVLVTARMPDPETGTVHETVLRIANPQGSGLVVTAGSVPQEPLEALSEYDQKVARLRQRGLVYPYEIIKMLTPSRFGPAAELPPGDFVEYDFDGADRFVAVCRPPGQNNANIVAGVIRNFTSKQPEGMLRVILLGDPSKSMGALAEPECRRIIAAVDLAESLGVPVEWFALSAGAKISMESGTENMDWIALVLRRLVHFTQAGGEVNVIVNGVNVGAQPYWNAEATMLQHTRGILIMTPAGAMVLTGKQALDYSGSVSAEDNQGIGGYERIMGPNGQAQYWARDIGEAMHILLRHYEHAYVAPGERFPRPAETSDPFDRDIRLFPHDCGDGAGFATIGEIFSAEQNAGRKRPFDIRTVMSAVVDQDHGPLERWPAMRDAEMAVVWDVHLGGYPVCLIGIESRPLPRRGFLPADGPDQWTAGTLFPRSSKKVARAINAASGNRPVVILANLSGFDGSPESLRELQLEYGAEIGRAVVNFKGPIVFCVVSRYHGGAYVVFSRRLNPSLEVAALEGSYASVIGGAPAAAVVFASEVDARTLKDARVRAIEAETAAAEGAEKIRLRRRRDEVFKVVRSEKLGEVAEEFDRVHSVHRALAVGSLHHIIAPERLRPYLISAVERGMRRCLARQHRLAPPSVNPELRTSRRTVQA